MNYQKNQLFCENSATPRALIHIHMTSGGKGPTGRRQTEVSAFWIFWLNYVELTWKKSTNWLALWSQKSSIFADWFKKANVWHCRWNCGVCFEGRRQWETHFFLWDGWAHMYSYVIFDDIMISMISIEIQHNQHIHKLSLLMFDECWWCPTMISPPTGAHLKGGGSMASPQEPLRRLRKAGRIWGQYRVAGDFMACLSLSSSFKSLASLATCLRVWLVWSSCSINVGTTIINHPFGNGLYHHIPAMYGDGGEGLFIVLPCFIHITGLFPPVDAFLNVYIYIP